MTQPNTTKEEKKKLALLLFEYIVAKLIGVDQIPPKTVEELNNELKQYSMTRYMKTLYFLCLTSCTILQEEEAQKQKRRLKASYSGNLYTRSLFQAFEFTTYPKGPVAHEVYSSLRGGLGTTPPTGMLFRVDQVLSLNEGRSLTNICDRIKTFELKYKDEANLAQRSLERLFGGEYTPLRDREETGLKGIKYKDIDTQMLIDVSHSFPAWIKATQSIEDELYAQQGVQAVSAFIDNTGIKGNISRLLKNDVNLSMEIAAFQEFQRDAN